MNDPHVETLRYDLITDDSISYADGAKADGEETDFKWTLNRNCLIIEMKQHCATEDAAIAVVGPFLRRWEIDAGLNLGPGELNFRFTGSTIVDRSPPAADGEGKVSSSIGLSMTAIEHVVRHQLPMPPPTGFELNDFVENMWGRYEGYKRGREPLAAMAYYCLTVLEGQAGTRANTASMFNVHIDVLKDLGELTSAADDPNEGRKAKGTNRPALTPAERSWVEEAIKLLIRRAGEVHATGATSLDQLTMSDLPIK